MSTEENPSYITTIAISNSRFRPALMVWTKRADDYVITAYGDIKDTELEAKVAAKVWAELDGLEVR